METLLAPLNNGKALIQTDPAVVLARLQKDGIGLGIMQGCQSVMLFGK